ncbi:MAG: metallophosphoesterase, partial [Myxococcales bacterium]|nr:metallophosphoesterase [Myxococcales bacterium]
MSLAARLDRFWRPETPATRLAALRILLGAFALVYLAVRLPHLASAGSFDPAGFKPIGVTALLGGPLAAPLPGILAVAALALAVAFVVGWRFAITGPLFAAALLWVTTYRNSWGMVFHTENLMVMHVLVVGLGASADAWSLDARRRRAAGAPCYARGFPPMPTRPEFAPMVRWFGPAQLLRTAGSVVISKVFGAVFDRRRLDARLSSGEPLIHDLTRDESGRPRERLVLDYVADTGDGWNSTYAVAYWSARPELTVRAPDGGAEVTTRRGDVLIFGGDLVYPAPNRGAYQQRLVTPFTSALGEPHGERPQVFAIPGNHDWYDNLAHFTRLFVDADEVAGRAAPQRRSYFALELPRGWWLLGVDIQLSSDIDRDQVAYFREVAARVRARATSRDEPANVILCTAEPYWIYEHEADLDNPKARALQRAVLENNLNFLERHVFKDHPIRVYLAGDLHHYRRH